jgi:hypothetical protein
MRGTHHLRPEEAKLSFNVMGIYGFAAQEADRYEPRSSTFIQAWYVTGFVVDPKAALEVDVVAP